MQAYITSHMTIQYPTFDIIHYRLGDEELVYNRKNTNLEKYVNTINTIKTPNSILISDSIQLKQIAKSMGIYMFDEEFCHVGRIASNNSIKQTVFEFLLLTKASSIRSYTVYPWISGFVRIASFIYGVRLETHINITKSTESAPQ